MQYVLRERRILACASSGHFGLATMSLLRTSPQLGQKRILTTIRPWLSFGQRFDRIMGRTPRGARGAPASSAGAA
jgi:hypothetical protein